MPSLITNSIAPQYMEHTISSVTVERGVYEYACCPNDPYPVLRYNIAMSRSTAFYDMLIIIPGILLTLLSMCVFAIGNDSGFDQLAYGISVIVVALLSQFLVLNMVPVCGELLWIDLVCCPSATSQELRATRHRVLVHYHAHQRGLVRSSTASTRGFASWLSSKPY